MFLFDILGLFARPNPPINRVRVKYHLAVRDYGKIDYYSQEQLKTALIKRRMRRIKPRVRIKLRTYVTPNGKVWKYRPSMFGKLRRAL